MTLYHAEQFIHIVASECEATIELRLTADYLVPTQYRAANDDPGNIAQSRPGEIVLRLYDINEDEIEIQPAVAASFLASKDFLRWLAEEALEIELGRRA